MATTTTITAIRATHCGEFITHKVLAACTTMSTAAKYPDLVYEVAFFQIVIFVWVPVLIINITGNVPAGCLYKESCTHARNPVLQIYPFNQVNLWDEIYFIVA